MSECDCRIPRPHPKPKKAAEGWCHCGLRIGESWRSSDANLSRFFNRLTVPSVPITFPGFRAHCERREAAGRITFGYRYLGVDNVAEGLEEACDLGLYPYLETLRAERLGRGGENDDLLYGAAYDAASAYDKLLRYDHKRRGEP